MTAKVSADAKSAVSLLARPRGEVEAQYEKLLSLAIEVKTQNTPEFMMYWKRQLEAHVRFFMGWDVSQLPNVQSNSPDRVSSEQ